MGNFHATTIVAVRRENGDVCIGGDGQVTMGQTSIMKHSAKKVRKIYKNTVLAGFAGSVADAFTLTEKFEKKLEEHGGNLKRAAVALAQLWRSDRAMRNLEALMLAADHENILLISGNGEVIEPDDDFVAIGSGGNFAYAAAHALYKHTDMTAEEIVRESLNIAASICVYTNDHISVEKL
jgi:ATP-dependent HslUV protease subunit HslV